MQQNNGRKSYRFVVFWMTQNGFLITHKDNKWYDSEKEALAMGQKYLISPHDVIDGPGKEVVAIEESSEKTKQCYRFL